MENVMTLTEIVPGSSAWERLHPFRLFLDGEDVTDIATKTWLPEQPGVEACSVVLVIRRGEGGGFEVDPETRIAVEDARSGMVRWERAE